MDPLRLHTLVCMSFVFSYLWAIGGNIVESCCEEFEIFVRSQFEDNTDAKVKSNKLLGRNKGMFLYIIIILYMHYFHAFFIFMWKMGLEIVLLKCIIL